MYMRSSISAQSCASVPPAPALTSRKASLRVGLARQQALELAPLRLLGQPRAGRPVASASMASSPSASASSISSSASASVGLQLAARLDLRAASWLRSRMSVCAAAASSQSFGSSARAFSSSRRAAAASQSKMPPQQRDRLLDRLVRRHRIRRTSVVSGQVRSAASGRGSVQPAHAAVDPAGTARGGACAAGTASGRRRPPPPTDRAGGGRHLGRGLTASVQRAGRGCPSAPCSRRAACGTAVRPVLERRRS